jgi:hypothetical protein
MDEFVVESITPEEINENVKNEEHNTVRIVCKFTPFNRSK